MLFVLEPAHHEPEGLEIAAREQYDFEAALDDALLEHRSDDRGDVVTRHSANAERRFLVHVRPESCSRYAANS